MRGRFVLATIFGLVFASAFAAAGDGFVAAAPQGVVTLTPTATLTSIPSASASPTLTATPAGGTGHGGGGDLPTVPALSPGMLLLLAAGLATVAVLLVRRL